MQSYVLVLTCDEVKYLQKLISRDIVNHSAQYGAELLSFVTFDSYLDIPVHISTRIDEVLKNEN